MRSTTDHELRVLIRRLYGIGRDVKPLTLRQIAAKLDLSVPVVHRVVQLDEVEMEQRRRKEAKR